MAGGLALLLSKGAPPKGESDDEDKEMDDKGDDEKKEAGISDEFLGDAFDALKSGDKMAFIEALKSAIENC